MNIILELARYVVPQLKATEMGINMDKNDFTPIQITFTNEN